MYREIEGDLIVRAKEGRFDVITHGCNCFNTMGAGIAPQMAKAFGCNTFPLENALCYADINKLGQIDCKAVRIDLPQAFWVVNSYTQYEYNAKGKPFDYEAFTLCVRKINFRFKGQRIGLPKIGAGLAGGNWDTIKAIIQKELKDCDVTAVIWNFSK